MNVSHVTHIHIPCITVISFTSFLVVLFCVFCVHRFSSRRLSSLDITSHQRQLQSHPHSHHIPTHPSWNPFYVKRKSANNGTRKGKERKEREGEERMEWNGMVWYGWADYWCWCVLWWMCFFSVSWLVKTLLCNSLRLNVKYVKLHQMIVGEHQHQLWQKLQKRQIISKDTTRRQREKREEKEKRWRWRRRRKEDHHREKGRGGEVCVRLSWWKAAPCVCPCVCVSVCWCDSSRLVSLC